MIKHPDRYYRRFSIPKGKRRRYIDAPKVALKVIQTWVGYHLARAVKLQPGAVGFVPGLSAVDGAARHCGCNWVFSTDLVDFFQTTNIEQVKRALQEFGYSGRGAETLAGLACLRGNLAQGSPCSPILSNLVATNLDKSIQEYADNNRLTYTRYADDIVLSGTDAPPEGLQDFVVQQIKANGWQVSEDKTRLVSSPDRLKVYGLLVHGEKPRLTKGYRNRIRALKHLRDTEKLDPERTYEALGHLSYARSVEEWEGPGHK
jgi:RNA-directed DNA polymerase